MGKSEKITDGADGSSSIRNAEQHPGIVTCGAFFFLHLFVFLEREEEREKEKDRNIYVWEKYP